MNCRALSANWVTARRSSRRAVVIAAAAVLACCAGCISRRSADPDRADIELCQYQAIEWPARITDDLDDRIKNTPRRITRLVVDGSVPESKMDPDWLDAARRVEGRIVYNKRFGQGIIRKVLYGDRLYVRFVSYSPLADRPVDTRVSKLVERSTDWLQQFLKTHSPGLKPTDEKTRALLFEGTQIRLREPKREDTPNGKPVGLVVHIAGLGSIEYEQPLLDELQAKGWAVLRIATPSVWWYESKPYTINSEAEIRPTAVKIARSIDDLVAEPAYTAEAALQYLAKERPDIPQSPMIMVGCSAGALAAPAVVARLPGRFDAAVLVAGGANLLKLSQTSDLTDGGVRVMWSDDTGNAAQRDKLYAEYLAASQLDPFHLASSMRHMPVLMVQAALDTTVQASGGDLLWECLGRPERWTFTGGHRLLFWRLHDHSAAIVEWINHEGTKARSTAGEEAQASGLSGSKPENPAAVRQ